MGEQPTVPKKDDPAAPSRARTKVAAAVVAGVAMVGIVANAILNPSATLSAPTAEAGLAVATPLEAGPVFARTIVLTRVCASSSGSTVPSGTAAEADTYYAGLAWISTEPNRPNAGV